MTISAQIIADSISPEGIRLTTMQLRYPRFIHAEFLTHRVFSRNASSSRAIPVARMIEDLRRDPAMPVYWGSNKPGMQAGAEIDEDARGVCQSIWLDAMGDAINKAEWLMQNGLHKQIANRILEPWAHINVVVTATDWDNFYELRRHADAQPEIKALADAMWEAHMASEPNPLLPGEWHLPYYDQQTDALALRNYWRDVLVPAGMGKDTFLNDERSGSVKEGWWSQAAKKISVARCARVSYLTHDGRQTTVEEDLALYERLVGSTPIHASPAEHQATPDDYGSWMDSPNPGFRNRHLHGNLRGWIQHRKLIEK